MDIELINSIGQVFPELSSLLYTDEIVSSSVYGCLLNDEGHVYWSYKSVMHHIEIIRKLYKQLEETATRVFKQQYLDKLDSTAINDLKSALMQNMYKKLSILLPDRRGGTTIDKLGVEHSVHGFQTSIDGTIRFILDELGSISEKEHYMSLICYFPHALEMLLEYLKNTEEEMDDLIRKYSSDISIIEKCRIYNSVLNTQENLESCKRLYKLVKAVYETESNTIFQKSLRDPAKTELKLIANRTASSSLLSVKEAEDARNEYFLPLGYFVYSFYWRFEEADILLQNEIRNILREASQIIGASYYDADKPKIVHNFRIRANKAYSFSFQHYSESSIGNELVDDSIKRMMCTLLSHYLVGRKAGKQLLSIIDPYAAGRSIASLYSILDTTEGLYELSQSREEIKSAVLSFRNSMFDRIMKYSKFGVDYSITDYNSAHMKNTDSFHTLVIFDFPYGWTQESLDALKDVVRNGNQFGYSIIIHINSNLESKLDISSFLKLIEQYTIKIHVNSNEAPFIENTNVQAIFDDIDWNEDKKKQFINEMREQQESSVISPDELFE